MSQDSKADPLDWRGAKAPTLDEFTAMAYAAYRRLPEQFHALCEDLIIRVAEFAPDDVLNSMGIEDEYDLLGLFQGIGLPFRSVMHSGDMPNMIWLYRRPILDYWAAHEDTLEAIVTHVLVHEIGHHFGLSDADMARIEASVD
jgi:predicted Zn-dependent protease with MMP-like domain